MILCTSSTGCLRSSDSARSSRVAPSFRNLVAIWLRMFMCISVFQLLWWLVLSSTLIKSDAESESCIVPPSALASRLRNRHRSFIQPVCLKRTLALCSHHGMTLFDPVAVAALVRCGFHKLGDVCLKRKNIAILGTHKTSNHEFWHSLKDVGGIGENFRGFPYWKKGL